MGIGVRDWMLTIRDRRFGVGDVKLASEFDTKSWHRGWGFEVGIGLLIFFWGGEGGGLFCLEYEFQYNESH